MDELRPVRVAAVQMEPRIGEVTANREAILALLLRAAEAGASLVVFPECALTGYAFESRAEAMACAEPVPGPSLLPISLECARLGLFAVIGMLERGGDRLYNTCTLVGRGLSATYRKVHLPWLGVDRFADPGDRPFDVHQAGRLRIGMHICYDGAFPEVGRVLALRGADLLVLPTNWPSGMECAAEHMMATRALENTVFTLAADRVGEERGFRFIGRSSIHDPSGATLARAGEDEEVILLADIDPRLARDKQLVRVQGKHEVNRIADRRPRFYGPLVEPNGKD